MLREVARGLYVGSAGTERLLPVGEMRVIRLAHSLPVVGGFALLRCPLVDFSPLPTSALAAVRAFADVHTDRALLVQCRMGLNRSASVAYMILRMKHGLSHEVAVERLYVRQTNPAGEVMHWPTLETLSSVREWADS